jgi:hypothetical protein
MLDTISKFSDAKRILGVDFISPNEIASECTSIVYTDKQLECFYETLPSIRVLTELKCNGMVLCAGPSKVKSLIGMYTLFKKYIPHEIAEWFLNRTQTFARTDKATPVWIAISKTPLPKSPNSNRGEQYQLISDQTFVPNVAEIVWCLMVYKITRETYLLPHLIIRSSSMDSDEINNVTVGPFNEKGLQIGTVWSGVKDGMVSLSVCWKLS